MKFEPTDSQLEKYINPAYEDILAICDEMNFQLKCGNNYIIEFMESILDNLKNKEGGFKREMEIDGNI
tara:strand:- start:631 stop:834 length:204 start_codon:yes stop_codon:yes gene_type:complete